MRANAARALGAAEDAAALDALAARAATDTDARVRVSAIRALAQLKDRARRRAAPQARRGAFRHLQGRENEHGAARPPELNELLEIAAALGRLLPNTNDERALSWLRQLREAERRRARGRDRLRARRAAQYLRERPSRGLRHGRRARARHERRTWQ